MKIKVAKQSSGDSGYIELSELFAIIESKLPTQLSMEEIEKAIFKATEELKPEISTKLNKGILNLSTPINIASTVKIESGEHPVGTMYFDVVNDRLRVLTNKGWKTV